MTPSALRRHRALGPLLSLLLVPAALATLPAASASPTVDDGVRLAAVRPLLDERARGRTAIRELGDQLDVAAARNDLRPAELRTLLRTDRAAWVDPEGRLFYVEPVPERAAPREPALAEPVAPLADTFALHSNPGADLTILLDVDGATEVGAGWSLYDLAEEQPAWDPGQNGAAFSDAERLMVQQVWASVAEDYRAFDVDVTTEDPGPAGLVRDRGVGDDEYGTRVLITPDDTAHASICQTTCGGVAYVGVFDEYDGYLLPAWVFPQALGDSPKAVAEAASHEAGHNLGLDHDGDASYDYFDGQGSWAPIMGVGYYRPVSQWSRGSYPGATNQQDDLAVIAGYLGLRPDEADGTPVSPAPLPVAEAVIATPGDVDAFQLGGCPAGTVVDVLPTALSPNLDISAELHRAGGEAVVGSAPASGFGDGVTATGMGASLTVPEAAENWVVTVGGAGDGSWAAGGYDDYGSIGAYTVVAPGCDGRVPAGVPGLPDGLTGVAGRESVDLTWTPPTSTGTSPVTSYVVGRLGSHDSVVLDASARSHTVTGLASSTDYVFRVRAVNAQGAGPWRTASARTLDPAPVLPSAPRALEATYDLYGGGLDAWWIEPATTGSNPITGYAVHLDGQRIGEVGATARGVHVAVDELTAGQHVLEVTAVTVDGESPPATSSFDVVYPPPAANDAVAGATTISGLQGSVAGDNYFATREATDPAAPAGSGAGGYSLWYSWTPDVDGPVVLKTTGGGTDRDTTLTVVTGQPGAFTTVAAADDGEVRHGLVRFDAVAGTRYLVVVDGEKTAAGRGEFSLVWEQVAALVPSFPYGVQAMPGLGSATVSWQPSDANGSRITGYTVTSEPEARTCTTTATTCTFSGLTAATAYTFRVVATNGVGSSSPSNPSDPVRPFGLPSAPPAPTAVAGDGSATVGYEPVPSVGSPVMDYTITAAPGGRSCVAQGYFFCEVTGLTNGTEYTFTVRARNEHGYGPASAPSDPVTPMATGPGATAPDRMAAPKVSVRDRKATVTWKAAADNGSPVTRYLVDLSKGKDVAAGGTARKAVLKRLKPGRYEVRVAARNEVGRSPWSATVTFRVR